MEEVIRLFKQIQETSSTNDKKAIIAANRDNELFKKCLIFLLDGNIQTGLSSKKISKKVHKTDYYFPQFTDVMSYLETHNTGTDDDISFIQAFIRNQPEEYHDFYTEFVTKSFRLGADSKVVNSVIPGLIPTWDVMLGTSIEHCKLPENIWFSLSQKLNGNRCTYYNGEFYTRQNKKYIGLNHIKADIEKIPNAKNLVFDGELIYKNNEGLSDSSAFQKGTGIANNKSENKEELKLVLFDVLPKEEFNSKVSKDSYKVRKQNLLNLKQYETENIEIVQIFYEGTDQSEIWKWLDYCEQHDMEGCMLNLDTPYECKRTKNLMKIKRFKEKDLRCVDINLAKSGKYKGLIGSITCKYENSTVDVGSGFSDEMRRYYTNNPKEIINHIVSIKYKEETTNKEGIQSLQFPIFITCRFDKDVADDE